MKKETQTQIMKPITVLSLVLLALLLLVPAASAETYTIIDEDMVFGGGGGSSGSGGGLGSVSVPEYFFPKLDISSWEPLTNTNEKPIEISITSEDSKYIIDSDSGDFFWVDCGGLYQNGLKLERDSENPNKGIVIPVNSSYYRLGGGLAGGNSNIPPGFTDSYYGERVYLANEAVKEFAISLSLAFPGCTVCVQGPFNSPMYWYLYMVVDETTPSSIQHVTVTYDDQSENYQVYVDTSDESVDVWVRGYVFGWLPVWTFGSNAFPPSTHFEWLTCPVRFLFWDVDWEVEVEWNGESKFIYWNLDTPPIDGGTIPEPDPPFPDPDPELPDDPDTFDPTTPFPTPSYNPSGLPNKIPTSLKEIIGFNLTEVKDRFKESTPFYSNAFDFVASAIEALFDFLFGLIAGTLGILIGFLSDPLTETYNFIVWTSSVVFSFMDFLIIPNHIMSFLADFVPVEIVNLALTALGLDILLNVLSIAIPDLITAYKSTVHTYYHKVDHGIQKGGKK